MEIYTSVRDEMKGRKFSYIDYGKRFGDYIREQSYGQETCIVCENNQSASLLEAQSYHYGLFEERPYIISQDRLLSQLFVSDKIIYKDIRKIFFLYQVLSEEMKERWKIQNYFDFVDIANEFFQFYKDIYGKEEKLEEILFSWQKEKFYFFQELKEAYDQKMREENFLAEDFIFRGEYQSYFLKKFKRVLFCNISSFSRLWKELFEKMEKEVSLEFLVQVSARDYDETEFRIKQLNYPKFPGEIEAYRVNNEWEESLYCMATHAKKEIQLYSHLEEEKKYVKLYPRIFRRQNKDIFDESLVYQFLELQEKLLQEKEKAFTQTLDIEKCLEAIRKPVFQHYYGFWGVDEQILQAMIEEEYRYLSIPLLEREYRRFYEENPEFYTKIKTFLEDLWKIEKFRSIEDMYSYFAEQIELKKLEEKAYPDVFEIFYQVLAELSNYEADARFGSYAKYFPEALGRNLYRLFLRSLHQRRLQSYEKYLAGKLEFRDWRNSVYEKGSKGEAIFLDLDDKSLPYGLKKFSFFSESQKQILGLRTKEEEILEQKQDFIQSIFLQEKLHFVVRVSESENTSASSFVEEFLWKQALSWKNSPYGLPFFLASLKKSFQSEEEVFIEEEGKNELLKENKELLKEGKISLGAYDWERLEACERHFYFHQLLGKEEKEAELSFGLSSKLLGDLCHRYMDSISKKYWKDILKSKNFHIGERELLESLAQEFQHARWKIPSYLEYYLEGIVFPRIVRNTKAFLERMEKKYAGKTLYRFQGEKAFLRERVYVGEELSVDFKGRADFVIESNQEKEIIDYKTGDVKKDQLAFYSYLLYGETENVEGNYYNLWENTWTSPTAKAFREENLQEFFQCFEKKEDYSISKRKTDCQYCNYVKICHREEE